MIDKIVTLALEEDTALGDITSENIFTVKDKTTARLVAKQDLILCGVNLAKKRRGPNFYHENYNILQNSSTYKYIYCDSDKILAFVLLFYL